MERRRRALRLAIQRAAVDLFEEHGVDAVTVEQIAASAGVSHATFHRFCASAEDAVTCHLVTSADDLAHAVDQRRGTTLLSAVREAAQEVFEAVDSPVFDSRRAIALCLQHPALRSRWLSAGREGQVRLAEVLAGGPCGPGTATSEVLAGVAMAGVMTAFEHWALDGGEVPDHLAACFAALAPLDGPFAAGSARPATTAPASEPEDTGT